MFKFIKMMITPEKVEAPRRFRIQYRIRKHWETKYAWHLDVWTENVVASIGRSSIAAHYVEMSWNDDRQVLIDQVEKILLDEKRTEYFG